MNKPGNKRWRAWIKLDRLVPLGTIIGAFVALLLTALGILDVSVPEGIILSLLGLLATDALIERMDILEKIQQSLEILNQSEDNQPPLMWELDMLRDEPFEKYLQGANELFVSGGSLIGLLNDQREVLIDWLSKASDGILRAILVNPKLVRKGEISAESIYRDGDNQNQGQENFAQETERSLKILSSLQKRFPGKIEIRLTKETPSVSIMIVDRNKARVSVNLYKGYPTLRPVFRISKAKYPKWFQTFDERYYNELWSKSTIYSYADH